MKILHLYKDYYPVLGGIENHVRALAEAQAATGHEATVLVTALGRETEQATLNGVRVIRAGRLATVASTPLSLALPRRLSGIERDITHLHFPYPVGEISQLVLGHGLTVVTYHTDVVRGAQRAVLRLYRPLMRLVLRRAARVIATSPNYVASSPHLRRLADRCVIVPLGVDVGRFGPKQSPDAGPTGTFGRNRQSPADSRPTLLFLGRLRYYKGLDTLLHALPATAARLVVGGDGPMRPQWEALARRLGLDDRVTFAGTIPDEDLPGFYRSGDLFVLPAGARSEAFGTVLLEAMASGQACITTELSTGTSFVVQDGVTGLVTPPHNPRALADAINRLLADDELRARMGQAGLARARHEFSAERMVERVQAVYDWAHTRSSSTSVTREWTPVRA